MCGDVRSTGGCVDVKKTWILETSSMQEVVSHWEYGNGVGKIIGNRE